MKRVRACMYCAVRCDSVDGLKLLDTTTLSWSAPAAREKATHADKLSPMSANASPVLRIVACTLREDHEVTA